MRVSSMVELINHTSNSISEKIPYRGFSQIRSHSHVPEIHPDSGVTFLEREDEGHVLKRGTRT